MAIINLVLVDTGKKLTAANAQIENLSNHVNTLNSQLTDDEKLMNQLKQENLQYGKEAADCRKAKRAIATKFTVNGMPGQYNLR